MIYKISPHPSLPKRGKERENFAKEEEGERQKWLLDYAKSYNSFVIIFQLFFLKNHKFFIKVLILE